MPDTIAHAPDASLSTLPGAAMLRRVRRLLLWALGAGLLYSVLGTAGRGYCPGGVTGGGGFLDADGRPTDVAPQCVSLTLQPSGIVYVAIAVIVVWTLTRVLRFSADEADAIRRIDRAVIVIVAVVIVWTIVTQVSFFSISLDGWDGLEPFSLDGPTFGSVVVDVSPDATPLTS